MEMGKAKGSRIGGTAAGVGADLAVEGPIAGTQCQGGDGAGRECTGVGGAVAAAGDAQVRGWGMEPKARWCFTGARGEGDAGWMA